MRTGEELVRNDKVHATLLVAVGGYILYLAYQILQKFIEGMKQQTGN